MVLVPKFKVVRATAADRDRVEKFMRSVFFRHEPLNVAMGTTQGPSSSREIRSLALLSEGWSLLAEAEDGAVLAVCLNGEISRDTDHKGDTCTQVEEEDKSYSYSRIMKLLGQAWTAADLWSHTPHRRALDVHVLGVDPRVRGLGLGRSLIQQSFALARDQGLPLGCILCTSAFSAKLAEQLHMHCVYSLPYSDVPDFPSPPAPHYELKVFISQL